jgi:Leucine-rich repeat (LRR) protein
MGPIPSSLGMVKSLNSLVIVGNGFSAQIPIEIGQLVNLRRLVISGNRLTGSIPSSIGDALFLFFFSFFFFRFHSLLLVLSDFLITHMPNLPMVTTEIQDF